MAINFIHSIIDPLRDRYAPISRTSNFRGTGQITPEEFLAAGDFLVYKFPSWSWSSCPPSRRVTYLPDDKQFLITRGVPCHRRLDDNFAGDAGNGDVIVKDGLAGSGATGAVVGEDDGWLRTGGDAAGDEKGANEGDVRTLDNSGNLGDREEDEDEIPDMEDEDDDDAIIRDTSSSTKAPLRTYTLYITYTPYYRTPRLYLSGYSSPGTPLPPPAMMEDIVGDYKDKTVTLEDFPFFDPSNAVKMASVHPCRHASVMKTLLDRADSALKTRRERAKARGTSYTNTKNGKVESGMEGLIDNTSTMSLSAGESKSAFKSGVAAAGGSGGDEWEVLQHEGGDGSGDEESAIRADQYLVVFLKFMAGLMPGIQYDFTMGV